MKGKRLHKFIAITLCVTLLTVSAGKVTRVSAVGTTIAASAAAALCAVGIVYCSYMALTGASVHVPDAVDDIQSWLTDMGTKVVQYPSGRVAYQELYTHNLALSPEGNLLRDFIDSEIWTWTAEKLRSWANDFSSTDVIQNIATYDQYNDLSQTPSTNFAYPFTLVSIPLNIASSPSNAADNYYRTWSSYSAINNCVITLFDGERFICNPRSGVYTISFTNIHNPVRNYLKTTGYYKAQQLINNTWYDINPFSLQVGVVDYGGYTEQLSIYNQNTYVSYESSSSIYGTNYDYPIFADADIYVEATGQTIEKVTLQEIEVVNNPQWPTLPPEDDNKPVIPYLKLPYDPNWVDPLGGPSGGGNWGLRLGDLLDELEELAGLLIEIGTIGQLINDFKDLISGQSGDEYYIYYDDSENNYYQYYTITNFGDNIYNYDIDVSDTDKHLPIDLNDIGKYTHNRYIESVKQSAVNGSSIIRDFIVFWYDIEPQIVYIFGGVCIAILLGAFIGKWGHS